MAAMEILAILGLLVGIGLSIIGGLWLLVKMFTESILWGLAGLFCGGIASLVFVIMYWEDAKSPFLMNLGGAALVFICLMASPGYREQLTNPNNVYQMEDFMDEETAQNLDSEFLQDVDPEAAAQEQTQTSDLDAWRELQEIHGTFYLGQVLEVDPATLTTPEQFKRYKRGLEMRKEDLQNRKQTLDTNNPEKIAEFREEVHLLKQRSQELKAAIEEYRAGDRQPQPSEDLP